MKRNRVFSILLVAFIIIYTGYVFADPLATHNRENGNKPDEMFKDFKYFIKDDILTVRLAENAKTDYVWHFSIENPDAVIEIDDGYINSEEAPFDEIYIREFNFRIRKGVDNTFKFKCYRRFEPEDIYKEHIIVISNSRYGSNIAVR